MQTRFNILKAAKEIDKWVVDPTSVNPVNVTVGSYGIQIPRNLYDFIVGDSTGDELQKMYSCVDFKIFLNGSWTIDTVASTDSNRIVMENGSTNETVTITWYDFWCKLPDHVKEANKTSLFFTGKTPPNVTEKDLTYVKEFSDLTARYNHLCRTYTMSEADRLRELDDVCKKMMDSEYIFRHMHNCIKRITKVDPFIVYHEQLVQNAYYIRSLG